MHTPQACPYKECCVLYCKVANQSACCNNCYVRISPTLIPHTCTCTTYTHTHTHNHDPPTHMHTHTRTHTHTNTPHTTLTPHMPHIMHAYVYTPTHTHLRSYMNRLCEELNDTLQEVGQLSVATLSKNFGLPNDFLVEVRLRYTIQ